MDKLINPGLPEDEYEAEAAKEINSIKEELRQSKAKAKVYTIVTIIALVTINIMLIFFGALWAKAQLAVSLKKAAEELVQDIETGIKEDVRQRITKDILKEYAGDHYLPDDYTVIGNYADKAARPSVVEVLCGMTNITTRATGVILNSEGYILTNTHVVTHKIETPSGSGSVIKYEPYEVIKAIIHGSNNEYEMVLVAFDPEMDLAIIKFADTPSGITPAVLCDTDFVRRGEDVALIGNTIGYGLTVSVGVISGAYIDHNTNFLLTDALALKGTSGAGLFNVYAELIGIISVQLFSEQSGSMAGAITVNSIINYIAAVNAQDTDLNITYTLSSRLPDNL